MGRSKDSVWIHFESSSDRKHDKINNHYDAKCRYCNELVSGQPERLKKHLKRCRNVDESIKSRYDNSICSSNQNIQSTLNNSKQTKLTSFIDKCYQNEKEEIDAILARMIFGLGLPLSLVEAPAFIEFCKKLRPSYELPSRRIISERLLNKEFENTQKSVKQLVNDAKFVSIATDGWTNLRNEPIVNFIITTPKPVFWKAIETKEASHTSQFISESIDQVIHEIDHKKLAAVITDNASNMKGAHDILKKKYPDVIFIGNFYWLNFILMIKIYINLYLLYLLYN